MKRTPEYDPVNKSIFAGVHTKSLTGVTAGAGFGAHTFLTQAKVLPNLAIIGAAGFALVVAVVFLMNPKSFPWLSPEAEDHLSGANDNNDDDGNLTQYPTSNTRRGA
jgi:hypothetical protein